MSNLWIFTSDGFYSSRQDQWCKEDEVMVRARIYEDLLTLADQLGMENPSIIRIPKGDYLYRMKVKQDDWTMYCAHASLNHLPDEGIKDTDDFDRYMAYLRIWEIMCTLQNVKDAEKRGNKKQEDYQRDILTDMCWPDISYPVSKREIYPNQHKTNTWIKKKKKKNIKRRKRYVQ